MTISVRLLNLNEVKGRSCGIKKLRNLLLTRNSGRRGIFGWVTEKLVKNVRGISQHSLRTYFREDHPYQSAKHVGKNIRLRAIRNLLLVFFVDRKVTLLPGARIRQLFAINVGRKVI